MISIPELAFDGELGRGAYGIVYRARWRDRLVAVKLLRTDLAQASPEVVRRFWREAAALARIRSPNLPAVYEADAVDGGPYLIMEFIEGRPLAQVLVEGGALREPAVLLLATGLASALGEVHHRSFIHRDVKPANVLLRPDGSAVLLDFGLIEQAGVGHGQEGVAGTFRYAAPEQTGMLKRPVDPRSDLYSVGVVLFEAATGQPPFVADEPGELVRRHVVAPVPDPRALSGDLSAGLAAILMKLLAKDPDDRYFSAADLLADIRRVEALTEAINAGERPQLGGGAPRKIAATETPLAARRVEIGWLKEHWQLAAAGKGRIAGIEGPGGMGKTRLVNELLVALRGDQVAIGVCKATEGDPVPFSPLRAALDELLARWPETASASLLALAGEAAPFLKQWTPRLARLLGDAPDLPAAARISDGFFDAVADFLIAIGRATGPTLLFFDDVQWLDEASREVLRRLAAKVSTAPMLVVCASRTTTDGGVLAQLSAVDATAVHGVQLHAFDELDLASFVAGYLAIVRADPTLVRQVALRSAGNPLAAAECLRVMLETGVLRLKNGSWQLASEDLTSLALPEGVLELVASRVQHLPAASRRVLAVASLIGNAFDDYITVLTDIFADADVGAALADGREAMVLDPSANTFVHDRVREALLATFAPEERRRWHAAIAAEMQRAGVTTGDGLYVLAQHHFLAGQSFADMVGFRANREAAHLASRSYAYEQAYRFFQQAQAIAQWYGQTPDAEFARCFGEACARTGRIDEALTLFDRALANESRALSRALILYARGVIQLGRIDTERTRVELSLACAALGVRLPGSSVPGLIATLTRSFFGELRRRLGGAHRPARGEEWDRQVLLAQAFERAGVSRYFAMDSVGMVRLAFESMRFALRLGASSELAGARAYLSAIAALLGRAKLVDRWLAEARRAAAEVRNPVTTAKVELYGCYALHFLGRTLDAETAMIRCLESYSHVLENADFLTGCADLAWNLTMRGYTREAWRWIERALQRAALAVVATAMTQGHTYRCYAGPLLGMLGQPAEGRQHLDQFRAMLATSGSGDRWRWGQLYAHLALLLVEQGDVGPDFDEAIASFQALGVPPARVPLQLRQFFVAQAYGRLAQLERAAADHKPAARRRVKKAIAELRKLRRHPTTRAHQLVIEAALAQHDGRTRGAEALSAQAEELARLSDNPWVLFEVSRLRARRLARSGLAAAAQREAHLALRLARAHGWIVRARQLQAEFRLELEATSEMVAPSHRTTATERAAHVLHLERHLQALLQVSLASSRVLDPAAQARSVIDELVRILGAERGFLFLCGENSDRLRLGAARNAEGQNLENAVGYSESLIEKARCSRHPVVTSATETGAQLETGSMVAGGLRSAVAAPLVLHERLVGVVYLDSRLARGMFDEKDVEILLALSSHIAVALETARAAKLEAVLHAEQGRRQLAELLRHASASLNATLELPALLGQTLDALKTLVVYDRALLLLRREQQLEVLDFRGRGTEEGLKGKRFEIGANPTLQRLVYDRAPCIVADAQSGEPPHFAGAKDTASWLAIPLAVRDEVIGVIGLDSNRRGTYSAEDAPIVLAFAEHAAMAIANATLFESIRWQATIDALTGLFNRGHFLDLAEQEVRRARRSGRPVSVLMVDVDRFKAINDTYGHGVGDQVLAGLARVVAQTIRDVDLCGRYGGEEFVLLLPEADRASAIGVAERIRLAIAASAAVQGELTRPVTVSVGVGSSNGEVADLEALIRQADAALYAAKADGRNCVRTVPDTGESTASQDVVLRRG